MRVNISMNWKWNNAVIIVGSKKWIVWTDLNNYNILKAQVKTLIVVASNSYLSVIHYPKDVQKCEVLLLISPGAKYFFRRSVASVVRKLILHLKKATLHLQWENQCWTCQPLVAFEIYRPLNLRSKGFRLCQAMWFKLGKNWRSSIKNQLTQTDSVLKAD